MATHSVTGPLAGVKFYLTGSHFFGTARSDSDWDFMAADSTELRGALEKAGFHLHRTSPLNVRAVYRLGGIEVQLLADLDAKLRAQQALVGLGDQLRNKRWAPLLWTLAYNYTRQD